MNRPKPGTIEERTAPVIEAAAPIVDGRKLRGLIPYGAESRDMGGWREIVDAGALKNARLDDLIATREHDRARLLGRHPTTLTAEDRDDGFAWAVDLPNTPAGEDVRVAVERGDLRSTSWRMVVGRDRWDGDVRHIEAIEELLDVTVTAAPAYAAAAAELRSQHDPATAEEDSTMSVNAQPAVEPEPTTTAARAAEGGLRVEDRAAAPEPTIEQRIETALRSVRRGESRALTTAASVSPGELSTVLFDRLRASSVILGTGIKTLVTDADSVTYPTLTADVVPAWYAEAAAITPGDPTFATLTATPRKLAHLTQFSNEVLDDSDPSIATVLNDHLIRVLALKLDAGLLEGSGTPPEITGLKNVAGKQTLNSATNGQQPTLDNIADAVALLEGVNVPLSRMRLVVHPRNVATLRKAKASTAGSFLWGEPTAVSPRNIFGVPVVTSPQLATNEVLGTSGAVTNSAYLYDVDSVVYVMRSPIEIELDRSRLFNSDQSEMRAKLRGDLISPTPTGIVRITGFLA